VEHLLTILIFFPALAGVLGFTVAKDSIRAYGLTITFIELVLSISIWMIYDLRTRDS